MMILSIIKEKKELLFGTTSNTRTKIDKMNEWQNIYLKCLALGLVREGKDYTYVRDVFWQNLKRTALVKYIILQFQSINMLYRVLKV